MTRFVTVIFGVLVFTFALWLTLREYAKTKVRGSREHAFNQGVRPEVIAHRGGALEFPENTMVAFDGAAALDPELAFELDLRLTRDDQLIVFHDDQLERTTDGQGRVRTKTLEEIKKLDAGYRFSSDGRGYPYRGKGVQIPTFEELLQKHSDRRMIVEIKDEIPGAAEKAIKLVKAHGAEKRILIASEHGRMVNESRRQDPEIMTNASRDEVMRTMVLMEIQLSGFDPLKPDVYCIPEFYGKTRVLSENLLASLHERKRTVFIWTVNDTEDMKRLVSMGVDGLITDRPSEMLKLKKSGALTKTTAL